MRKVAMRNTLLCIGMSALVSVTVTCPAIAKKAVAGYTPAQVRSAYVHHARHWKRGHRAFTVSRRFTGRHGRILVYRRSHHHAWTSDEIDQLFACLLSQPFVTCP
jgi:hypothetical protein